MKMNNKKIIHLIFEFTGYKKQSKLKYCNAALSIISKIFLKQECIILLFLFVFLKIDPLHELSHFVLTHETVTGEDSMVVGF